MRDLDQLRERGDETTGRKLGLFAMAGILSVSAVFAMGILIGRDGGDEKEAPDPLAQLALPRTSAQGPVEAVEPPVDVRPEALSFPATLTEDDEDPLVAATVRAAELEHASLTRAPHAALGVPPISAATSVPPIPPAQPSIADLPASTSAREQASHLAHVAQHDPMVARAMPDARAPASMAPHGTDGAYVLQVVSYQSKEEAESFANTLRARGHKAFVTAADVPGRGRFNRVRIGPFSNRAEAAQYQDSFEGAEHMHTILVAGTQR